MTKEELEVKPEWVELPEKASYWACFGLDTDGPKPKRRSLFKRKLETKERKPFGWSVLFYTKEDAEAYAASEKPFGWEWNGREAQEVSLSAAMLRARQKHRLGVDVDAYKDGKWVIVKRYLANVPLPEDLR